MNWNPLKLDEKQGLHHNSLFWIAIVTPITVSILLSIPIISSCDLEFSFTPAGYKQFTSLFSFPISLLTLPILFGVMIGRFHASKQRSTSIRESERNNTFRNYYDHRSLFIEHTRKLDWEDVIYVNLKLVYPTKLYKTLFPNNSPDKVSLRIRQSLIFETVEQICADVYGPESRLRVNDKNDLLTRKLLLIIGCEPEREISASSLAIVLAGIFKHSLDFCELSEDYSVGSIHNKIAATILKYRSLE